MMFNDIVKLTLPLKPEYISTIRLTTASLANRAGFDVEDVEDMVQCSAEASNIAFKQDLDDFINIEFQISENSFNITIGNINSEDIEEDFEMHMSEMIIMSLSDRHCFEDGKLIIDKKIR
ncbi:MAG: histidine kinase [Tissierellia bacterium]|nr:histidine kinase [Tissierellia bacterium]